jgi:transcriptional regulator with XRE-family HTH domain
MASLGQWLREEREARRISLEEIAAATKIVPRYLEALENDHLDVMPGGFFIKGIIRTYARAVGLDPEEVLGRYKAAGLLSARPEHGRTIVAKPAEVTPPQIEPALPAVVPEAPAEPIVLSEPAPVPVQKSGPDLLFEEASHPEEPSGARKRFVAWTWRGLAVLAIGCAAFFVLRPILSRPRPPQPQPSTVVGQSVLPPAQKAEPGTAPGTAPTSAPESEAASQPAPKPQAPPVTEEVWKGVTIEFVFQADTWIQVYTDGDLKINGLFPAGATARAQADEKMLIHTGNAGGFTFRLNGQPAKSLGRSGQILTDIKITPENLKDFLEGPSSGLPPG